MNNSQIRQAIVVWAILNLVTSIFLANAIVTVIDFVGSHEWCKARGEEQ